MYGELWISRRIGIMWRKYFYVVHHIMALVESLPESEEKKENDGIGGLRHKKYLQQKDGMMETDT